MTAIRRSALTLALTLVAALGSAGSTSPAQAAFSDSASVSTGSITTQAVAPPTQQEAIPFCTTTHDPVTNTSTTRMTVKIEWWESTSPGITGYLITAHPTNGTPYELMRTGPTDETYHTADEELLTSQPRFTITTLTSYGWTAQSRMTEVPSC